MNLNARHRRRGSMYVVVLGCAMLVTVIGLSAVTAVRIHRRSAEGTTDFTKARLYAKSAIELGLLEIQQDPSWRDNYPSGVWLADQPIGDGTFTLEGVDPDDNNLKDSASDPLVLTATGVKGDSRYKLQVTLVSEVSALTCLEVALHAGNDLIFNSAFLQCDQTISANDSTTASGSMIEANVEVVNTASGMTYQPPPTTGITPRTMPDSTVFDYYTTNGATVNYAGIPSSQGKITIEEVVISPKSIPPYITSTNAEGIYVVNCGGGDLRIRNCRIVGTLVVLNPGTFSIQGSINWAPAVANYPSLLVSGSAELAFDNAALSESSSSVNFNPPGTPYEGVDDGDMSGTYPSLIKGLVYTSGDVTTSSYVTVDGVLVVGVSLIAADNLVFTYQQTFLDNPPHGFSGAGGAMRISPGSWRQVVD